MLRKKLPPCAAVSTVASLSVVSTIGVIFNLISNFDKILKYGEKAKKSYEDALKMSKSLNNTQNYRANNNDINECVNRQASEPENIMGGDV